MKRISRWFFMLLVVAMQIQGSLALSQQLGKPAHFHAQPAAGKAASFVATWISSFVGDVLEGHHHAVPSRQHSHTPDQTDVVYVDSDSSASSPAGGPSRAALDALWPIPAQRPAFALCQAGCSAPALECQPRQSQCVIPPDRPPRV